MATTIHFAPPSAGTAVNNHGTRGLIAADWPNAILWNRVVPAQSLSPFGIPFVDASKTLELRDQRAAIKTAVHVICWPIAAFLLIGLWDARESPETKGKELIVFVFYFWLGLIIANVIGRIAYRLCSKSTIPPRWMAAAMALVVDYTVVGWRMVGLLENGHY